MFFCFSVLAEVKKWAKIWMAWTWPKNWISTAWKKCFWKKSACNYLQTNFSRYVTWEWKFYDFLGICENLYERYWETIWKSDLKIKYFMDFYSLCLNGCRGRTGKWAYGEGRDIQLANYGYSIYGTNSCCCGIEIIFIHGMERSNMDPSFPFFHVFLVMKKK